MVTDLTRSERKASAMRGTRSVQSYPPRLNTRTRSTSRRQMKRNPSCLISYTHRGPDGTAVPSVGRHGWMKPAGRRAGETERQSMGLHNGRTGRTRIDNHGRSAVSISSFANGALGEHRRHDSDGIRLEIAAPRRRSRRSIEPTFGSSGRCAALASGWPLLTAAPGAA
jgi:hypothetical protein